MNNSNAKENIPTEQPSSREETWIPCADGNEKRSRSISAPPSEGTQTSNSASLLKTNFGLPKENRLRKPGEFRQVYEKGKRYDGRFMSVFVLPNEFQFHRLGITASRKGVGKAVFRNRAKRLLREAFRLSKIELNALGIRYDFVLNARRSLLNVKMQAPLADLSKILERIRRDEMSEQKAVEINQTSE